MINFQMVPFLCHFKNGTIFVDEFWAFPKMVPFLLGKFGPFLKCYHFYFTIFVWEFWAFSKMVPFLLVEMRTFEMVPF